MLNFKCKFSCPYATLIFLCIQLCCGIPHYSMSPTVKVIARSVKVYYSEWIEYLKQMCLDLGMRKVCIYANIGYIMVTLKCNIWCKSFWSFSKAIAGDKHGTLRADDAALFQILVWWWFAQIIQLLLCVIPMAQSLLAAFHYQNVINVCVIYVADLHRICKKCILCWS